MEVGLPIAILGLAFNIALWLEGWGIPTSVWESAGYRRALWLFYLLVIPGVMTVLYLALVRPKLRKELQSGSR